MDKILVTEDLGDLQNELHGISSNWYNLGVQLGVKLGDLENIKKEGLVPVDSQREMLMIWLKQVDPYPTRNALIKALKQRVIDEQQLANQLRKKYTSDGVAPSASTIQSPSGSHASSATTPVPAAVPAAVPQTSTSQTSGSQIQRQQGSRQTGTKHISAGGVSKATKMSTVTPTAANRGSSESGVPKAKRPKKTADLVGGYTLEFVDPPPDDLLCQKCEYVAKEPQQLKCCGAFYCKSCLVRITWSVPHNASCSVKRTNEHFFDHKNNGRIQKLNVKCTNSDHGCDWTGELKDLDDHRSQCPKEEIPCTLSEVGCEARVLRENLDDHIAQDQQQHLHCAMTSISRLKQELATTREELQEVQETLSNCLDEVRTLPMIFKMSNYAQFKEKGDTWYSTPFYSHRSECKLCLRVQPLRSGGIQREEASIALEVMASSEPYLSLAVEVLNPASDDSHFRFIPTAISTSNFKGCGQRIVVATHAAGRDTSPHFGVYQSEYPDVQYLQRNRLFFRVSESEKTWLYHVKKP